MPLLASRLSAIKPSPTLAVTAKAKQLKDQGVDIISLAAGEPDFDTPDNIKRAAIQGIKDGKTKYTPVSGTNELKQAIINKFEKDNKLQYNLDEIIVSTGGKQVIYNLFMATINEGDEVVIPAPYWVSYPDMVLLCGGKPVIVNSTLDNAFKPSIDEIDNAITPKTKWLIINSPSNPAGSVFDREYLMELLNLLKKHPQLHIMSDDIYEHILFDGATFTTIASIAPEELKSRIFTINGVSKSHSMTGWRIGYGAGSKEIVKAMSMIQSQNTSNPCSIIQIAALEALSGSQEQIKPHIIEFQEKRDLLLDELKDIQSFECYKPQGAFYLFPKCDGLYGAKTKDGTVIDSSNKLASYLLEEANVAVVPGIAFGMDQHFRISYATSKKLIIEACVRIKRAINLLNL